MPNDRLDQNGTSDWYALQVEIVTFLSSILLQCKRDDVRGTLENWHISPFWKLLLAKLRKSQLDKSSGSCIFCLPQQIKEDKDCVVKLTSLEWTDTIYKINQLERAS